MLIRILKSIITRIKNLPDDAVQKPRIWKYKLLSTAKNVHGKARLYQPVLFLGPGRIVIGKDVNVGCRPSPYPKFMVFALILGNFGVLQKCISYNINRIRAAGCLKVVCSAKIYMAGIDRKRFPC